MQVTYEGDLTAVSARSEWAPEFAIYDLQSTDELFAADPNDYPDDIQNYLWTWTDRERGEIRSRMFAANLGVPEDERVTKQGDGCALTVMDSLTISDRSLIDEFEAVARKREIPCQLSILPRGGTDAGPMQRARGGYRTMTLSVPTRYNHTVTECIHQRDLQSAIDLLAAWLES